MTPEQIKILLENLLTMLAAEFAVDARNEPQRDVSSALDGVSHRLGSAVDDLDFHIKEAMS